MKKSITLPLFNGFYNTNFECDCEDNEIENDKNFEDYNFNYADYNERVVKACIVEVQNKLIELGFNCQIEFENIDSPKFYNYLNDSANVTITFDKKDYKKLIRTVNKDFLNDFDHYLSERYTNRPGFISFYSNDSDVWFDTYLKTKNENFDHCLGALLEMFLIANDFDVNELVNSNDIQTEMNYIISELITE